MHSLLVNELMLMQNWNGVREVHGEEHRVEGLYGGGGGVELGL